MMRLEGSEIKIKRVIRVLKGPWIGALSVVLLAGCTSASRLKVHSPPSGGSPKNLRPARSVHSIVWKNGSGAVVKRIAFSQAAEGKAIILRLPDLIKEALKKNPEIRAFQERWAATQARIPSASSLDDPVFSYTNFIQRVETRVGPQRHRFGISQKFPFYGKLSLKGEIASREAREAGHIHEALKIELIARVKSTYYGLFLIHKAIQITEKNLEVLRRFARVANVKYATGKASQQDVLKAEVRLSRLANDQITLQQQKETAEAALNTLLNRSPAAPLGRPAEIMRSKIEAKAEKLQQLALTRISQMDS